MQKIFINYANDDFSLQQEKNSKQAKEIGKVDRVISYSPNDIDKDFYNKNKKILNKIRGGGYWLWKFYIIHKTLTSDDLKNGDIVFYADSGTDVLKDLTPVFELPKKYNQDVILFADDTKCKQNTKRDTFILMDCDEQTAHDFMLCAGGFNIWRKSAKSIKFIEQCLKYATHPTIINDNPSELGAELPEFQMHRHDQCIFSLVAYKNQLKIVSNLTEKIYGYNQDTFLNDARANHNRSRLRKYIYTIAMLPEKFQKHGGFWKYILRQFKKL